MGRELCAAELRSPRKNQTLYGILKEAPAPFLLPFATTMFQAAESSCEGAYGSLDGTHLSPTVQVNAAQQVLGLRSIL